MGRAHSLHRKIAHHKLRRHSPLQLGPPQHNRALHRLWQYRRPLPGMLQTMQLHHPFSPRNPSRHTASECSRRPSRCRCRLVARAQVQGRTGVRSHIQQLGSSSIFAHVASHCPITMFSRKVCQRLASEFARSFLLRRRRSYGNLAWHVCEGCEESEFEGFVDSMERCAVGL